VTATITSASNTQIAANVTVAAAAPDQTVTITVTSHGYGGSGFIQTNNNPPSGTDTATVNAIPAPQPKILRAGANITGSTGIVVVTGQQIALTSSVTLPSGLAITSYSWSVSGTNIGGYTPVTAGTNTPATGNIVPTTVTQANVTFYWVYPGQGLTAKYSYCMVNMQCSTDVQAAFNVSGVTNGLLAEVSSRVSVSSFVDCSGASVKYLAFGTVTGTAGYNAQGQCQYAGTPGIKFTASGTAPSSGSFKFVQLITQNAFALNYTLNGTATTRNLSCGIGLDNFYPYPANSSTTTQDSPMNQVSPAPAGVVYSEVKHSFTAKMYLMWQSTSTANSISVPIGYLQWHTIEDGLRSPAGSWSLAADTSWGGSAFTVASASQNFDGYPTWSTRAVNGQCSNLNILVID
jgi:hypothetical protein